MPLKLVMVRVAPILNGFVLLSGFIWFSVNWTEVSIGLFRFGFPFRLSQCVGLVRFEILLSSSCVGSE